MRLSRRGIVLLAVLVGVGAPGAWLLARDSSGSSDSPVVGRAKRGEFKVTVTTSGELRALKSIQITLPPNTQQAEAYQMKLASIVPEGTLVKAGDVVAELDRSSLATKRTEIGMALQMADAQYEQ